MESLNILVTIIGVSLGIFFAWLFGGISSYFMGRKTIGGDLAFYMGGTFGIISGVPTIIIGVAVLIWVWGL